MSAAVDFVIVAKGVRKSYGGVEALRGADLRVRRGEVLCLLGPNGAGKTTLLEILEGYRGRDAGTVQVLGKDPSSAPRSWRARIGIVTQHGDFEPELTVREQVARFAGYFPDPLRIDEVLDLVGLSAKGENRCDKLSGGERRRLDIGIGIVGRPEMLFLDEPTTGLDPEARQGSWRLIERLRDGGTSILLTTHYMEEAQVLADRVAMIVGGRIGIEGTAEEMASRTSRGVRICFRVAPSGWTDAPASLCQAAIRRGDLVEVHVDDEIHYLRQLIEWSRASGHPLRDLEVTRPNLGDVYLELVGNGAAAETQETGR